MQIKFSTVGACLIPAPPLSKSKTTAGMMYSSLYRRYNQQSPDGNVSHHYFIFSTVITTYYYLCCICYTKH